MNNNNNKLSWSPASETNNRKYSHWIHFLLLFVCPIPVTKPIHERPDRIQNGSEWNLDENWRNRKCANCTEWTNTWNAEWVMLFPIYTITLQPVRLMNSNSIMIIAESFHFSRFHQVDLFFGGGHWSRTNPCVLMQRIHSNITQTNDAIFAWPSFFLLDERVYGFRLVKYTQTIAMRWIMCSEYILLLVYLPFKSFVCHYLVLILHLLVNRCVHLSDPHSVSLGLCLFVFVFRWQTIRRVPINWVYQLRSTLCEITSSSTSLVVLTSNAT